MFQDALRMRPFTFQRHYVGVTERFCAVVFAVCSTTLAYADSGILPFKDFVYPVMTPRLASNYGTRVHPIVKMVRHHNGVDLAAPEGAPIRAVANGIVVFADPYAKYGNLVVVAHGNEITTHYGHCQEIKAKTGKVVKAGEIIGTVGATGGATGPHLHFEIRKAGVPQDPEKYLPALAEEAEG